MSLSSWAAMAEQCQQINSVCRQYKDSPVTSADNSTSLSISQDICVHFPTYEDTLCRIDIISERAPPQQLASINSRYWEACQRVQEEVSRQYITFCRTAQSVEQHGGGTDRQLQEQVSRGLSVWYEASEARLANMILARFGVRQQYGRKPQVNREDERVDAKHILRRAFAANPSPTDAERDYLARQTGMTYRQVTVWFQNSRSRRISTLPKRGRQQSTAQPMTSPPQTASTMASLHEVEQHLRNPTDSPLAQHIELPAIHHQSPISTPPIAPEVESPAAEENNKAIVSRSQLMITEPRSSCAFDGHARDGNGDVGTGVQTRKIVPLRKSRLTGKKPAPPAESGTTQRCSVPTRKIRVYSPTEGVQSNPTDILSRAQGEQARTVSTSSVSTIDSALDGTSGSNSRVVSSSSGDVVTLPLGAMRSVSGSSAEGVDAALDLTNGFDSMERMIPMFNFFPPTPSNTTFNPSNNTCPTASTTTANNQDQSGALQFDPIDFSALLGFPSEGTDAAQDLLRDLEELDFEQFLHSPSTSGAGTPDEGDSAGVGLQVEAVGMEGLQDQVPGMEGAVGKGQMGEVQLEYLFESMAQQNADGEVDPAIWEMLRGILNSDATDTPSSTHEQETGKAGENVLPMTPAPTPVDGIQGAVEGDPFALAVDVSALVDSTQIHSDIATNSAPMTVQSSVGPATNNVLTSSADGTPTAEAEGKGNEPDWQGLLDFTEMFDAFWTMVDTQEGAGEVSAVEQGSTGEQENTVEQGSTVE